MSRARAVALALVLSIAACTSTPPPKPEPTPREGGTITVAVRDLATLDPAKASSRAQVVLAQIYDSLTSIDPATGLVRPAAAKRWISSKNGLVWNFRLADARYSDGTHVRARDFAFAFSRVARKNINSAAAYTMEQVKGYGAVQAGRANTLAGVKATGPTSLTITLEHPFAELPYVLAHPALAPLPEKRYAKSGAGLERGAVTNGPFGVVSFKKNERATLTRNTRYPGTKPHLDGLVFRRTPDIDQGWRSYLAGEADVAAIPASVLGAARVDRANGGFTPAWGTLAFGPNLALAKYAKQDVRRALSLAIDREAISRTVYGGAAAPATGIIPEGVRGYREGACSVCVLDRDRARNIFKAAFKKLPSIRVDHLAGDAHRKLAQAIAGGLKAVGFRVTLRAHTPAAYVKLLKAGKQDFAELGWSVDVPSPDGFLAEQLRQGSPDNFTGFKDARFDKTVDRARKTRNEGKRVAAYVSAEKRALSLMPLIPIVFVRNTVAVAARVHDVRVDGAGVFDAATVWVTA